MLGIDAEMSAQGFNQRFRSPDLAIRRKGRFTIRDNADADGFSAIALILPGLHCGLILPSFGGLNLAIFPAISVAYHKMTIQIIGILEAIQGGKPLDIANACPTVEDFNVLPVVKCLLAS